MYIIGKTYILSVLNYIFHKEVKLPEGLPTTTRRRRPISYVEVEPNALHISAVGGGEQPAANSNELFRMKITFTNLTLIMF
jgi:hypothetical protein